MRPEQSHTWNAFTNVKATWPQATFCLSDMSARVY